VLQIYRDLAERRVELVITRIVDVVDRDDLVVESLFDDDIVAVAATQNPWTRRRRIDLAELVNEPWTLPSHDTGSALSPRTRFAREG
jgi:DNA-binding transcriptional LysR family regulator